MTTPAQRIESRANPKVQQWRRLAGKPAGYREAGLVWLEGEHLCSAYVAQGSRPREAVLSDSGAQQPALVALAASAAAVFRLGDSAMAHIGPLGSPPPIAFAVDWPGDVVIDPSAPSLVLDRLQDPGNVGTLMRSAAAFGFTQVLALAGTAALWSPKVLRAGMGAHFSLRLVEGLAVAQLESLGLPLLATSSHAAAAIHEKTLPWPCAWVLGHEGQGIDPELAARCTDTLRIAQPGGGESLNVAVAGAICLHESARQRLAR